MEIQNSPDHTKIKISLNKQKINYFSEFSIEEKKKKKRDDNGKEEEVGEGVQVLLGL